MNIRNAIRGDKREVAEKGFRTSRIWFDEGLEEKEKFRQRKQSYFMRIEGKQSNYCNLFTPSDPQLMMNSIQDLYVVKQTEALLIQKKKKKAN
jgi:hypothetical protein